MSGGGKKEEPAAAAVVSSSSSSASAAIPSINDENFGKWMEDPKNVDKLVASIEKLK